MMKIFRAGTQAGFGCLGVPGMNLPVDGPSWFLLDMMLALGLAMLDTGVRI
jgi:hypothetical protein